MNRRGFLAGLGALIGGIAIDQAIPFGRVWSFPSVIKPLNGNRLLTIEMISRESLRILEQNLKFSDFSRPYDEYFLNNAKNLVGSTLTIRKPQRYSIA